MHWFDTDAGQRPHCNPIKPAVLLRGLTVIRMTRLAAAAAVTTASFQKSGSESRASWYVISRVMTVSLRLWLAKYLRQGGI